MDVVIYATAGCDATAPRTLKSQSTGRWSEKRTSGTSKLRDFDFLAHQHEVELDARNARRERRQVLLVGAAQAGGAHEQVDLVRAPEGVEVAGHDHRLVRLGDEIVQISQLVLALAILERQVHEEDAHVIELELDDQPLDAGVEVVEALALDARRGQERIALLAHDGHEVVDRALAVLALVGACSARAHRRCVRPG